MTRTILLLMFGLTFIAAGCNMPAWWRLLLISSGERFEVRLSRAAVLLTNTGVMILSWFRVSLALLEPDRITRPLPMIYGFALGHAVYFQVSAAVFGMVTFLILLGEIGWLIASGRALKRAGQPRYCLPAFLILMPLWILFVGVML